MITQKKAHLRRNLCHLIWSRHLMKSRAGTNRISFIRKRNASCVCTYPKLPSRIQLAKKENEYTENKKTIFSVIDKKEKNFPPPPKKKKRITKKKVFSGKLSHRVMGSFLNIKLVNSNKATSFFYPKCADMPRIWKEH